MTTNAQLKMRSWLFAPGDSEKKTAKAVDGPADIAILDLEDAVVPENKPLARAMIHDFLRDRSTGRERIWVRINPLDRPYALSDLAAIVPAQPGGIVLPKAQGRDDVEVLHRYLEALETAHGIARGSTPVMVLATETAEGMFRTGDYKGSPRIAAMSWGAEDLADSLGASANTNPDGSYTHVFELARSLCLLGAASAGVPAIETIQADFRDLDRLRTRAEAVRRMGYRGMMAIHPAQVEVINQAFSPRAEEVAEAREIVALFEANPTAGTIGWKGGMLDRPHLSRARQLLAQAESRD